MTRSILAGATYFAIVFSAAFALGVLRVMFAEPAIGKAWATLAELPFTLAASWLACGWIIHRFRIAPMGRAIVMSASAFALLMGAELAGSVLLFGRTLNDQVGSYATTAGALGLAGQIAFGLFPAIQCGVNVTVARPSRP